VIDSPFERYKDALRRGHAASLRGEFDTAMAAYQEAAAIAPDRAMPQASLAGILARTGRISESLAAYELALARQPEDEASLRGRAEMLAISGRPAEAAETLDRLSDVMDREGRLKEATEVARRALGLAESRARRQGLEAMVERLRATGDTSADELAESLGTFDGSPRSSARVAAAEAKRDPRRPVLAAAAVMTAAAEAALDHGDRDEARRNYLEAAAAQRSIGNLHAAMDQCYQALAISPADGAVHLALTELYLDRGWRGPAADKLVLLGRLSELGGDDLTRARLCTMAAERFPDDARFTAICG
jgi:tetratricopeptide (TPR) repeat protein